MASIARIFARSQIRSGFGRNKLNVRMPFSNIPSFLNGFNSDYVEAMHESWMKDNSSVHASWDAYFKTGSYAEMEGSQVRVYHAPGDSSTNDSVRVLNLIRAYQNHGHRKASLDPLGLVPTEQPRELEPSYHGFSDADLKRPVNVEGSEQITGLEAYASMIKDGNMTLQQVINKLESIYCKESGYQYAHVENSEQRHFLRSEIEKDRETPSKEKFLSTLERLARSDRFEHVLKTKFSSKKRFGLEGLDSLIPGMKAMIEEGAAHGVGDVVIGMPHRGRLNVLANIVDKSLEQMFLEFDEVVALDDDWSGSGDVKYHLGASTDKEINGKPVHLTLLPNPSHLEAVNTVVLGKAKNKMRIKGDETGESVLPVILHGDAAFAGQGVVYETMQISRIPDYHSGGTIHIVCNNQVGFTTDPVKARCTRNASDLGKAFNAPIFSVNADNVMEVQRSFEIATRFRQRFQSDVIIDLIGYRKHGHNEQDLPEFTQPIMYSKIRKHPSALNKTILEFTENNHLTADEANKIVKSVEDLYNTAFQNSKSYNPPKPNWLADESNWKGIKDPGTPSERMGTGVTQELLAKVANGIVSIPKDFNMHKTLKKIMNDKAKALKDEQNIDWGTGEALAIGTLLMDGIHCRLSGQDVERGTFSHRHAVLRDVNTGATYTPLNNLEEDQKTIFTVTNSPLSEFGVLGFELGYSMESPHQLVMWEAQFGDFVNGAQVIIDQFLSAGESKWYRQNGLVMLLPHGQQGMGPEHSSCRIERFLQCCDENEAVVPPESEQLQMCNWQVTNPTTPANYFHLLRRQVYREFRKPLIVASPKNLLRHKWAVSSFEDFGTDHKFRRVLPERFSDELIDDKDIQRVVLCSGKIYYELLEERREKNVKDVALVSLEQLSPFPFDLVAENLARYPNAKVIWSQEEPRNMGAWTYVSERITTASNVINGLNLRPEYVGRMTMASTAPGTSKAHDKEQKLIISESLGL